MTQGGSPVWENRTPGSVRGAARKGRPYRDPPVPARTINRAQEGVMLDLSALAAGSGSVGQHLVEGLSREDTFGPEVKLL